MFKGKRHRRHGRAKPVQQAQSPACSSSPSSPVKEKGRRRDEQHKVNKRHKNKKRLPSSSQVFKKHGLNSESPQAGSSDPPVTGHERTRSGSFDSSQVKAQEARASRKRSLSSLQRAPPHKAEIVYESDFEFEYKDETQAKVQLQALQALRSPPSSPQRGVSLKKTTPVSDCEYENQAREVSSLSDEDSESKRRRDQTSPSQSPSSSLQMVSVFTSESEGESALPSPASPALPERVESSLIPPLRYRSDIKPPNVPLMIDGKKSPRVFAEIPPGGHEDIEFIFPENPDDDPNFYDPDSELPEAKRRRVEFPANSPHPEQLAQREGSPPEAQEVSNPEQSSVPESEPSQFLDLESSLDLATWSNPEPLPNLERPSAPESVPGLEICSDPGRPSDPEMESPHAPIRNELPIKEQIEATYEQDMVKKKEEMERDKRKSHERNRKLKEGREKAKRAMEERKIREDSETQKRGQEEQKRRQKKVSQDMEELERRRARARAEEEQNDVLSTLREMLDQEERTAGPRTQSEPRGNQSIARREALQIAMDSVKLLARKKEKEKERERGDRGEF
ncbi:hypothetical protein N7501_011943 [Penicillium viridicatum]|nr:hypothetical protein N7501_011943 [Penicillium viridicatum]